MKNKFENIDDKIPEIFYPFLLSKKYKDITGNNLNLLFPSTLSEKIQWLKLFDSTVLKGMWADKIKARELFCNKIPNGEDYLKPLIGVWNNFDEIDFNTLPDKFILKLNHGCGFNTFVINKNQMLNSTAQFESLRQRINIFQNTRYYLNSLELHYKYIIPKVFAEEIVGGDKPVLFNDWMIYCFNGKPLFSNYILHYKDGFEFSYINNDKFEKLDFTIGFRKPDNNIVKPKNYEKMFEFARILSKDFKFVRVDFIEYRGKLYFAEMTFTPYSGFFRFNAVNQTDPESKKIDKMLGKMLKIW